MIFASPLFLCAAAAGLIPVVLHLIRHHRAVEVPFSTLQFLLQSVRRTNRRRRVEDLSLLLVRMAILVLLALGLAGPILTTLEGIVGSRAATAVVIILDNSTSMATVDGGQPRFEAARKTADEILALLHDGDSVALLPTGGPPGPELGQLTTRHDTVRQALAQCQVSHESADLAARLQEARKLLEKAESTHREIYVITDNQALSWQGLKGTEDEPDNETAVVVVNFHHDPAPNVTLQKLQLESPAFTVGVPIQARVEVRNTATIPQQKHLELHLDGSKKATGPTLNLAPGATLSYAFQFTLDRGGVHKGEVRLAEEDGLPLDNSLHFGLVVDPQVHVAIVKPRSHEIPYLDDTFYLEQALAPEGTEGWAIRARLLTPEQLASEPLAGYALVYWVNLPAPAPETARRLRDYAAGGGHLIWIMGQNVRPGDYNRLNTQLKGQLLPAVLGSPRERAGNQEESWHIGTLDRDHPALAPLTEPASLYQSVLVHKHFPLELPPKSEARVLARLQDGQPLLVEQTVGSGSILLLGTGVHVEWTNLPLKQLFLPLFARLTFHYSGSSRDRFQVLAGAPLAVPVRAHDRAVPIDVILPSGAVVRAGSTGTEAGTFKYADTHEVGVYQLRIHEAQGPRDFVFAVNGDPAESDPACLSTEDLKQRFGKQPLLVCEDPKDLAATVSKLREGTSLRMPLLAAVLVALVLEALLANYLGGKSQPDGKKR